jgi:hypothetical protein
MNQRQHTYENAETAVCENAHQKISYTWNPRTLWDCPVCAKREQVYEVEGELDAVMQFTRDVQRQVYFALKVNVREDVKKDLRQLDEKCTLLDRACERLKEVVEELVKEVRL